MSFSLAKAFEVAIAKTVAFLKAVEGVDVLDFREEHHRYVLDR